MTRVRAYTVAEVGRALGMTSVEVHKAIERSLLRAFTINKAIRVPAKEVERVQANVARGHRHEIASQRHTAQGWRRRSKMKGPRTWTFERQPPRSSSRR
jgi:hypothetical protein